VSRLLAALWRCPPLELGLVDACLDLRCIRVLAVRS
jgi:hypothetical protein